MTMFAVQDFLYFKVIMVTGGPTKVWEYWIMLAKNFRIFMFADFIEEVEQSDWIDFFVFGCFTLIILIIFTNILIAFMGDAHELVHS
jgi:hypothetical protein